MTCMSLHPVHSKKCICQKALLLCDYKRLQLVFETNSFMDRQLSDKYLRLTSRTLSSGIKKISNCRYPRAAILYSAVGRHQCQLPPEADADTDRTTAHIMPPTNRYVQRFAGLEDTLNVRNLADAGVDLIPVFCGRQLHCRDVDLGSV
jgi:hypothetical protein